MVRHQKNQRLQYRKKNFPVRWPQLLVGDER
jgi:hypothetical protein